MMAQIMRYHTLTFLDDSFHRKLLDVIKQLKWMLNEEARAKLNWKREQPPKRSVLRPLETLHNEQIFERV
jgi:hypothetical protein